MAEMAAVILAGGFGTRLRPYTYTIPKPLLPIGERPVLEMLIGALTRSGVERITLCLGYLAPLVIAFVQSRADWQPTIDFVIETEPLGTAAPLRLVRDPPEHFLVVNGDTLTDLDFAALDRFHRDRRAAITVFAPRIEDQVDYGLLDIEPGSDRVRRYVEKPLRALDVSSGIYAVSRQVLRHLPATGRCDMPKVVERVLAAGDLVAAFRPPGVYWRDIGRQDHFEAANREIRDHPERFAG
jgi:NDP-sugar pyrophosphorylase family protein